MHDPRIVFDLADLLPEWAARLDRAKRKRKDPFNNAHANPAADLNDLARQALDDLERLGLRVVRDA
jgi:hypothetical protein